MRMHCILTTAIVVKRQAVVYVLVITGICMYSCWNDKWAIANYKKWRWTAWTTNIF